MRYPNNDGLTLDGLDIYYNGVWVAHMSPTGAEEDAAKAMKDGARALGILQAMADDGSLPYGSPHERDTYELLGLDLSELED